MAKTKLLLKRLQVDLNPEQQAKLEYLRSLIGLSSQTEAVRAAISFAVVHLKGVDTSVGASPILAVQNDPLGLIANPRTSMRMVQLCRERFLRTKDLADLQEWAGVLEEVLELYGQTVPPQWVVSEIGSFDDAWLTSRPRSISSEFFGPYPKLAQAMKNAEIGEDRETVKRVGRRGLARTA